MKATRKEHYGDHSSEKFIQLNQKILKTKKERYGEHLEKVMEKTRVTNLERYGVEYVAQNPESLQKMIDTCQERYGGLFNPEKNKRNLFRKIWSRKIFII